MDQTPSLDDVLRHVPPKELQKYLLGRLDLKSLKSARCVSKLWQSTVDPVMKFRLELSDSSKKYVEAFGSSREISSLVITGFHGTYPLSGFDLKIKELRVTVGITDACQDTFLRRQVSNRRKKVGVNPFNFRRITQDFRFVNKFHIASLAVKSFCERKDILGRVHLPNVEEIVVTFFDGGFRELMPFMKNYFPKLKAVNIANVAESRMDRPILYSWVLGFVGRHRGTLSKVTLILPEAVLDGRGSFGGVIGPPAHGNPIILTSTMNVRMGLRNDLKVPPEIYTELKTRLEATNSLDQLIWDVGELEGTARYDLGTTLLMAQTKLSVLHLDNLHLKDAPMFRRLGDLLPKLSETLQALSLGGCFCGMHRQVIGTNVFNCSWVHNCHRLKNLQMVVCGVTIGEIDQLPAQSLTVLNLGNLMTQSQIEFVAKNMVNLETWNVPQRGCLVNIRIPPVSFYLFEVMLYLPKLTKISISSECADLGRILEFVRDTDGISVCLETPAPPDTANERDGNIIFHIDRTTFTRDHSQLADFIAQDRDEIPVEYIEPEQLIQLIVDNIMAGEAGVHFDENEDFNDILFWHDVQERLMDLEEFLEL